MKIPYIIPPGFHGRPRPFVEISLKYRNRKRSFLALADTGADYCTLPREVGETLGIDVLSGKLSKMTGIGNMEYVTFMHTVTLLIGEVEYKSAVTFSKNKDIPPFPILGHIGFFDHFKVLFNSREEYLFLKPVLINDDPWPTP